VKPDGALSSPEQELIIKQLIVPKVEAKTPKTWPPHPLPSTCRENVYETPKHRYGNDVDVRKEEAQTEEE